MLGTSLTRPIVPINDDACISQERGYQMLVCRYVCASKRADESSVATCCKPRPKPNLCRMPFERSIQIALLSLGAVLNAAFACVPAHGDTKPSWQLLCMRRAVLSMGFSLSAARSPI